MLRKIALASGAVELAPRSAIGMAIGTQIAQPQPAAIATAHMGTKVPRGVHRARTSVGRRHGSGGHRRRRLGMHGVSLTQDTRGLVREARKRFGLGGALALRFDWHRWRGHGSLGLGEVQHDEKPHENEQSEVVEKQG